jgi:hypothetical protein
MIVQMPRAKIEKAFIYLNAGRKKKKKKIVGKGGGG